MGGIIAKWLMGLGLQAWPFILSYLEANALQAGFDALDEGVETALEKVEARAKATPDQADDRRAAILRKYFDGWKNLKKS
jgi:hypothetical protein